jgi:dTDP-4-amino-4,6-dideoxygalactose transaminase
MRFQPDAKASALGFESAYSANAEVVGFADLPVTEDICSRIVSLPIHDDMTSDDVGRVVAAVEEGGLALTESTWWSAGTAR